MKRLLSVVWWTSCAWKGLVLLLLVLLPPAGQAQDYTYATNNGTITLTKYTGSSGDVAIPDTLSGMPVTSIGDNAFYYCPNLTSVTIPDSVTNIGANSFAFTLNLTNITLGNGVRTIGSIAFYCCSSLRNISLPNSVTNIGDSAFVSCTSLTNVLLSTNIASIGPSVFSFYSALTSINIPTSVKTIGDQAFTRCGGLTNVTLPNTLTAIGTRSFSYCGDLTGVFLPDTVTSVGYGAFDSCTNLTSITVGLTNPSYSSDDGILFNLDHTTLVQYPPARVARAYQIPSSVTTLAAQAFDGCTSLTNVTLDESLTNIGVLTFAHCTGLIDLAVPASVVAIGGQALSGCTSLSTITVDPLNPAYRSTAGVLFNQNQSALIQYPLASPLADYQIPEGVVNVLDYAFSNAPNLTNVTIPNSVTNIGFGAFQGCGRLTSITVDTLNRSYSSVDGVLFDQKRITLLQCPQAKAMAAYSIPDGVTTVGSFAFSGCAGLEAIVFGQKVTNIATQAFIGCSGLQTLRIGISVTTIGYVAFNGCSGLTSVTFPRSLTTLAPAAFVNCTNLSSVYFQGNAPSAMAPAFGGDPATVYYLPGTTGWGPTFGGLTTVLWNPVAQHPILAASQFGFAIRGNGNLTVVVEASPELSHPVWTPVATNILTDGLSYFSAPELTNSPARFYRLRSP